MVIVSGLKNSYDHLLWCAKLRGMISGKKQFEEVIFKNYGSFEEIFEEIKKYNVYLGITADTSVSHLFNSVDLPNITLYNPSRVDRESLQSLSSDSPLGFCRYSKPQFPCFLGDDSEKLSSALIKLINCIQNEKFPKPNKNYLKKLNRIINNPSKDNHKKMLEEYKSNVKKERVGWINEIYNPEFLLKKIHEGRKLINSNWKICPLTKFGVIK